MILACVSRLRTTLAEIEYRNDVQQGWKILKEYCAEQPETLFLADVFSVVQYAENQYTRDSENIKLLGGWLSTSPLTQEVFDEIGAADAAEALYAGDGVKLLIRKDKDVSWMETYLQERFGPCELRETAVIVLHDGEDFAEYEVYPLSE